MGAHSWFVCPFWPLYGVLLPLCAVLYWLVPPCPYVDEYWLPFCCVLLLYCSLLPFVLPYVVGLVVTCPLLLAVTVWYEPNPCEHGLTL